jgi:hypothetical protein
MPLSSGLSDLFRRDLTRLLQEIEAFPDDETLWRVLPGVTNSAGTLVLHLEGNLREYVGRLLGGVAYQRKRDLEFTTTGVARADLARRIEELRELVSRVIEDSSAEALEATYPDQVLGRPLTAVEFLIHLHGHLNFHLGQLDYLRRVLTAGKAVQFAGL